MRRGTARQYWLPRAIGVIVVVLFLLAAVAILVPIFGLRAQTATNGGSFAPKVTSLLTPRFADSRSGKVAVTYDLPDV